MSFAVEIEAWARACASTPLAAVTKGSTDFIIFFIMGSPKWLIPNYNIIYLNDHFIIHKRAKIMNIKWSVEDRQFIKEHAAHIKDKDLAKALTLRVGRPISLGAVRKLRQRLGIIKKSGRGICELEEE